MWLPPSPGEQVVIACIGGNPETAMIIGSLWSDANPAPGKSLKEIVISARTARVPLRRRRWRTERQRHEKQPPCSIRQRDTGYARRGMHNLLRTATLDVTKGER
ncbi:baseplate assembly protein V [Escherichia coli]|uniref:Baseplate assembly protein V n=1 Tax=Escherichia coli TaxID=562 RepID=A0A376U7N5_ECOLX|nr:baseplate assembly protein V [Escherichia coli]